MPSLDVLPPAAPPAAALADDASASSLGWPLQLSSPCGIAPAVLFPLDAINSATTGFSGGGARSAASPSGHITTWLVPR